MILSSSYVFYDAVNFKILYKLLFAFGTWQKGKYFFVFYITQVNALDKAMSLLI